MLFQAGRMVIPERDAFVASISARATAFGICAVSSQGLVTDWGMQSPLVTYIARQRRTQLSIVLAGHGYFDLGDRIALLGIGDAVLSAQRRQGHEGYGGSPSQILIVDWEPDGALGREHHGAPVLFRIAPVDVAHLRAIVARASPREPAAWAEEVIAALRALGLPAPRDGIDEEVRTSAHVAALFRVLAHVRTHLHEHPSIAELATMLGISERHVRRAFVELDRDLGTGVNGWRDFLGDTRIGAAQQLLSVPGLTLARVATLAGYRSPVALCHAFADRRGSSPGELARGLRERWEIRVSGAAQERFEREQDRARGV